MERERDRGKGKAGRHKGLEKEETGESVLANSVTCRSGAKPAKCPPSLLQVVTVVLLFSNEVF